MKIQYSGGNMRTIYDGFTRMQTEKPTFFAGANTGNGFVGEYNTIASEENRKRVWIIKGGSGTGKSTLMGKIAAEAETEGHRCVRYLCSSDPDSLDAVVIDDRYAVVDGTAPHVWEMQYPGASSEILYVGKYWKRERLEEKRDEIRELCRRKQAAFRAGYTRLAALSRVEEELYETAMEILDRAKLEKVLLRLLKGVHRGERTGGVQICRTWTVSVKGLFCTDGLYAQAENHWYVRDLYQTAPCFFAILTELCAEQHVPVHLSQHPVNDRVVEAYIPALSLHISMGTERDPDKTICMSRFVRKELLTERKGSIRLSAGCARSLLQDACTRFREAGESHAALEAIYREAMDFGQMNRDTAVIRRQIRKILEED